MIHFDSTWSSVISLSFSLFLLMDGFGNIPLYLIYLKQVPPKRQKKLILRELFIALIVILLFSFIGEGILSLLKVSQASLLLSGGIILFMIAIQMIFMKTSTHKADEHKEPFIVPLAIPFIAGPAVLAAVMIYSKHASNHWVLVVSIFISWFFTTLIMYSAPLLQKLLGEKLISALECLMGLILTLISVQMFLEGLSLYIGR